MKGLLFLTYLTLSIALVGQVTDDFSDGDFGDGLPLTWIASQTSGGDDFVITSGEVQSNGPAASGNLFLSTNLGIDFNNNDVVWTFKARYTGGGPSGSNRIEIYLISDIQDVTGSPNGYYIGMGETGSTDGIDLFKTGSGTPIINDGSDLVGSGIDIHVRVTRTSTGMWTLEADASGGDTFSVIGTVTDTDFSTGDFFGFYVSHTSTRFDDFFFDDFTVTITPLVDTDPPTIQSVAAISDTEVDVQFNEDLDPTTAQNISNYAIDGSITVTNAVLDADNSLVHLTTSALTNGTTYTLTVNNVEDVSGNAIAIDSEDSFQYLLFEEAVEFDVVINEFMPDPNPVVTTLPDAEFVELYNRSNKYLNLENWTLDGQTLPVYTLAPDSYVLVVEDDDLGLFAAFSEVIPIATLSLNNSSADDIILLDDDAANIHSISFEGSAGGISTELINPNGPDYSENNYGLCVDPDGGTPGEQNSIFDDTPDTTAPTIESITVISNTQLDVLFSEVLEETSAENSSNYSIDGGIAISSATLNAGQLLVQLVVDPLVSGEIRTLTVNGVEDLSGNPASDTENFEYLETQEAVVGDVIINEFLSNPVNNSDDFIELLNTSDKFIDMAGWNIGDETSTSEDLPSFILRPDEYLIIYDEDASIDYSSFGNALSIASLTLNNADDQIEITSGADLQIAFLAYGEEQDDGVSLELINPSDPCLSLNSYAPSVDISGSTPGSQNSVFDDTPDTEAPTILSYNFDTNLTINFSEVMDDESLIAGTYSVSNGITVNEVGVIGTFPTAVNLSFNEAIEAGILYNLTISGVSDCAGNEIEETSIEFGVGRSPSFNELIITEIMFDPDPQVELPNQEFLEVYNATSDILSLEGINLTDASATITLPSRMLNPGEYYILASTTAASEFESNAIGVSGFPSLNNSGEQLILSLNGRLIFSLNYDPDWHDEEKTDGGYSLEMRDIQNPCLEDESNWGSSEDSSGGTPGETNSVSETIPDSFGPEVIAATAITSDSVRISFSEKIDPESIQTAVASLNPNIPIDQIQFNSSYPSSISVTFTSELEASTPYTLSIENVTDCSGNEIHQGSIVFALPVQAENDDIRLSEVLFNPRSNGVDFVEVYNDSEKYISLKNWKLGNLDDDGSIDDIDVITSNELVINPNAYLVFTTDANILLTNYPKGVAANFIEVSSMPTYANDEGTVLLIDQSETVVENFSYNEDFHYNLLENVDGVSLERVSFQEATSNGDNWRSASSTEGFATPGYSNSQSFQNNQPKGKVTASPEVFIPGNTGSGRDFTTINYQFDQPGQFANVNIYDQTGRLVKNLAQGVLLSTSGFLRWDGDTNDGSVARMGYHLIIFEIYDSSGNSEIIKETVVVGRDF